MKSPKELIKINKLIDDEKKRLESIASILTSLKEKGEISETVVRELHNASSELNSIVENLTWRLINALKQGYDLDEFD